MKRWMCLPLSVYQNLSTALTDRQTWICLKGSLWSTVNVRKKKIWLPLDYAMMTVHTPANMRCLNISRVEISIQVVRLSRAWMGCLALSIAASEIFEYACSWLDMTCSVILAAAPDHLLSSRNCMSTAWLAANDGYAYFPLLSMKEFSRELA